MIGYWKRFDCPSCRSTVFGVELIGTGFTHVAQSLCCPVMLSSFSHADSGKAVCG
jgi:hypothetical protein